MPDGPVGITFKETMRGGFAMDATEPADGARRGEQAGSELALHAEVTVPDVDAFVADPAHAGRLSGTIEATDWAAAVPGSRGVFNLFKPGNEPSLRLMVYELACERNGTPHYLAGQKLVRDDLFDMWRQTTTLYTRLHQGTDKSGPVVGAGILTVSVTGLIGVISSLKAVGTDSKDKAAEAVDKFGKFFMGALWESYVKRRPADG